MEFTDESTKELNELLMIVVKELDKIRKLNREQDFVESIVLPSEEIQKTCRVFKEDKDHFIIDWFISLSKDEHELVCRQVNGARYRDVFISIAKRDEFGFKLSYDEEDKEVLLFFLKHYPEARKKLLQRVETEEIKRRQEDERIKAEQERTLEELKRLKKLYNKEATIEIEVPETNNLHTLEVVEKDGKKIGTLNFNGLKLRIIASDGIEIVNKSKGRQKIK